MDPRFECINQTPSELYHYTLKANVDSITSRNMLRMGDDGFIWGCLSKEDIIAQFNATVLNPHYARFDGKGGIETIQNTNKDDYVILKVTPKYDIPLRWFIFHPDLPPTFTDRQAQDVRYNPYALSVAYQGNLRISSIESIILP